MRVKACVVALLAVLVLVAGQQRLEANKLVETVIRFCAKNATSAVSCWALQSSGGWAIDQGLTAAWNRIYGQPGGSEAKAAPGKPPPAPPKAAAPAAPSGSPVLGEDPRFQRLDQQKLSDLLKGVPPPAGWSSDPQTKGVILYAPARPGSQSATILKEIESSFGQKPAAPPAQSALPPLATDPLTRPAPRTALGAAAAAKTAHQRACESERAKQTGLSLTLIVLAPEDQRGTLVKRWHTEVVAPCAAGLAR